MASIFGYPIQTVDDIGRNLMIAGFVLGAFALVASSVSAYLLYRVSNAVQSDADQRIAEWTAKTQEAKAEAARANESAAAAILEQEKIKQQIAFRRLTKEQHDELVNLLSGHRLSVAISSPLGDTEATIFALDLEKTLEAAGIRVNSLGKMWAQPPVGIFLSGPPNGDLKLVADSLMRIGLRIGSGPVSNEIEIIVGSKPSQF